MGKSDKTISRRKFSTNTAADGALIAMTIDLTSEKKANNATVLPSSPEKSAPVTDIK